MRFPSRLLLTAAVVGAAAAGTGTAMTMAQTPAAPTAPDARTGSPTTGSAALGQAADAAPVRSTAVGSARERAAELVARARPRAPQTRRPPANERTEDDAVRGLLESEWQQLPAELREQVRAACAAGRLAGLVCEGA